MADPAHASWWVAPLTAYPLRGYRMLNATVPDTGAGGRWGLHVLPVAAENEAEEIRLDMWGVMVFRGVEGALRLEALFVEGGTDILFSPVKEVSPGPTKASRVLLSPQGGWLPGERLHLLPFAEPASKRGGPLGVVTPSSMPFGIAFEFVPADGPPPPVADWPTWLARKDSLPGLMEGRIGGSGLFLSAFSRMGLGETPEAADDVALLNPMGLGTFGEHKLASRWSAWWETPLPLTWGCVFALADGSGGLTNWTARTEFDGGAQVEGVLPGTSVGPTATQRTLGAHLAVCAEGKDVATGRTELNATILSPERQPGLLLLTMAGTGPGVWFSTPAETFHQASNDAPLFEATARKVGDDLQLDLGDRMRLTWGGAMTKA